MRERSWFKRTMGHRVLDSVTPSSLRAILVEMGKGQVNLQIWSMGRKRG